MRKGKNCLAIFILCLFGALSFLSASAAEMRQITVVIDDSYPLIPSEMPRETYRASSSISGNCGPKRQVSQLPSKAWTGKRH